MEIYRICFLATGSGTMILNVECGKVKSVSTLESNALILFLGPTLSNFFE